MLEWRRGRRSLGGKVTDNTEVTDASIKPRTWALIIWGLYLASYVTFFLTYLVGLVIAYMKRGDLAGTPFQSHMRAAINTFWITLGVGIIGVITALAVIGYVILVLLALWHLYRVIRGLVRAADNKPY